MDDLLFLFMVSVVVLLFAIDYDIMKILAYLKDRDKKE